MKIIITGSTGLVGSEVVKQGLRMMESTEVVALARRPVAAPDDISYEDAAKLRSVVIEDYESYPDEVRREFADADACIWTVSITPNKSQFRPFDEVVRVCQTSTLAWLHAMVEAREGKPFRFIYMSGFGTSRDQTKKPPLYPAYMLMRGETENQVLSFAASQDPPGSVEACVVKPAMITSNRNIVRSVWGTVLRWTNALDYVTVEEVADAMLQQVRDGFEKEPLENDDLKR